MQPANRVIYNTAILYIKLIVGLIVGLITTRLVLSALGEKDFGIYALVAGVIGMLGILNTSMSSASMRFIAHGLGSEDTGTIKKTFNTTLTLHFFIGIAVLLLMEIGGFVLFNYFLNIPEEKISDAQIIFHIMVISSFITIISVPYDAVMNAHENMLALSLVDLLGVFLSLCVALVITLVSGNLLIIYGFLTLFVHLTLRILKQLYSVRKYSECKIDLKKYFDKDMSKKILSFSGWNLFGSIASISVTQARSVILNMFLGVSVNAADGISTKVSEQVNMISVSMTRALNPQLIKSEGGGRRKRMIYLTVISSKFSSYLFAIVAIPIIVEAPHLLSLWLKNVPEYAIIFCQLTLVHLLIEKLTFEITTAIRAVGIIKNYTIAETTIKVLNLPIAFTLLHIGFSPYYVFVASIFISIITTFLRLYFGQKIIGIKVREFTKDAIKPILLVIFSSFLISYLPHLFLQQSILRLLLTFFVSTLSTSLIVIFWGLTDNELKRIKDVLAQAKDRVKCFL